MQRSGSWPWTSLAWLLFTLQELAGICDQGLNCHVDLGSCQYGSNSTGTSKSANVLNHLLSDYDNLMRPHFHQGVPTDVECDVYINSMDSVNVDSMDFSTNVYIRQSWLDPRLAYNETFPNISRLTLDSKLFDKIWVPDLFFSNEKKAHTHCITMPNRLIRIAPNGTVLYSARFSLTLACHMSLEKFPLDYQHCPMQLESYGYTTDEIRFHWREKDSIQFNDDLELPQFDLTDVKTADCKKSYITGNFTCLRSVFYLTRKYGYYMMQTYIPSVLIVVLSWVSFWINIDAVPARISLGLLTVLTMTTQSVGMWMSLPRVSYVKAIDIWMSTCVFFVFASMLEFAIVNTLARKEIRRMSIRERERIKTHQADNSNTGDMIKRMTDEYTYGLSAKFDPNSRMLARKVDKVSRRLFPSSFILFNVFYWCWFTLS